VLSLYGLSYLVVIFTEFWNSSLFMAVLLVAGLALVSDELPGFFA
jgi:hypothetical protein